MQATAAPVDPLQLERHWRWRARLARWRADPVSVAALAAIWVAVLASGVSAGWVLAGRHGALLLQWLALQPSTCALLALVLALAGSQRSALRTVRQARLGWLATLPGCGAATVPALARRLGARAAITSAALWALPEALVIAGRPASLAGPGPAWLLVVAAPWAAALLAGVSALRRDARSLQAGRRPRPAATTHPHWLPVVMRWQWSAFLLDQRGRKGAWMLLPLLLMLPAGLSPAALVLAVLAALLAAAVATLWSAALATVPAAARLLRATPWRTPSLLAALLRLPATLLLSAGGAIAAALGHAAGSGAAWLAAVPAAFALLHAAVVCALRHHPRRIAPALLLHLGLQLGAWQALPPLAPLLLLAQLLALATRALRA